MYVGPFYYLNSPRISQKGLYADLLPRQQADRLEHRLVSPVTHTELLGRIDPGADHLAIPRGMIVFDEYSQVAVIYVDHCIESHLAEVVRLFELDQWIVEHDDQYVCPRCGHLEDLF
jgi:hypothetical protein